MLIRVGLFTKPITPPVIVSFSAFNPTKASGCAPIVMDAQWVIRDGDNTSYKLVIVESGEEFPCTTTNPLVPPTTYSINSGTTYLDPDPLPAPPIDVAPIVTLAVVRRSDSAVISSLPTTCVSSIATGGIC